MFGKTQEMNIGFRQRLKIGAARGHELLEGAARAVLADAAGDRRLDSLVVTRAARKAEGLRHGRGLGADEDIGLQPLHRPCLPRQRKADEGEHIGARG